MGLRSAEIGCAWGFSKGDAWWLLLTFSLPALSGLVKSCRAMGVRAAGECRTVFGASSAIWNLALTFLRLCSAGLRICCEFADWMLASGCLLSVYEAERHREGTCLAIGRLFACSTRRLAAQLARCLENIEIGSTSRLACGALWQGGTRLTACRWPVCQTCAR